MPESEIPQEPFPERDDKHSELYGTREYPPGLPSPQRLSQPPAVLHGHGPICSRCDGRLTWVGEADGGYYRHLDLISLGEPHRAETDVLGGW